MEGATSKSRDRNQKNQSVADIDGAQPRTSPNNGSFMGTAPGEPPTLTDEGALSPTANPFAVAFSEDVHLFAGLSGTEDFFELWEDSVISTFDGEDVGDSLHGFQTDANSGILKQSVMGHSDGEDNTSIRQGGYREIRLLSGRRKRKMWTGLHELEKVHCTSNTQQKRQSPHQISTESLGHHEPKCKHWKYIRRSSHSAESRRQLMDQRHLQNRPRPHDLGTGGDHISSQMQPLRARIWRFANVLHTCSFDAPAFPSADDQRTSTCPACRTSQTPQATLKIWR